ncbi:MAG: helix-turn-helix domain-containing protein [Mariprofundaceae bacterium]|nr:helix-turn-helix domain-containing protein [Mariprofundaceae bacterium]
MTKMTRRKSELLAEIEKYPPLSIYQLAAHTGRNYRRVFDHVKELAGAGLLHIRPDVCNGRRVSMVESIAWQRLQWLDEMFAFKAEINATQ